MPDKTDTQILQVLSRQVQQHRVVDCVLAECRTAELAAKRARLRAAFMSRAISKLQSSQRNVLSADAPTEATDVAAETSNAGTAEAADAATAKTSKMAPREPAGGAPPGGGRRCGRRRKSRHAHRRNRHHGRPLRGS